MSKESIEKTFRKRLEDNIDDKMIEDIKTVEQLLEYLEMDISKANKKNININNVFEKYRYLLIEQYAEDECSEISSNIIISPLKKELWERYEKDLFRAEDYLNKIGVETRCGEGMDRFRGMKNICDDVARIYGCEIND